MATDTAIPERVKNPILERKVDETGFFSLKPKKKNNKKLKKDRYLKNKTMK
jgi:hypothetical protein